MAIIKRSLIRDAMVHMKQQNGSSFAQIRKHLEANYGSKLATRNKEMLSLALKGLVQSGSVEKEGSKYKLGLIKTASRASKENEDMEVPKRSHRKRHTKTHHFRHRRRKHSKRKHRHHRRRRHHSRRRHHKRRRR